MSTKKDESVINEVESTSTETLTPVEEEQIKSTQCGQAKE